MCGIAGIISKSKIDVTDEIVIKKMLAKIAHRGPDSTKIKLVTNSVLLGHNRLSIIDLDSRADQPMSYGKYSIVFNGEIYNYVEIKKSLVQNGYVFTTTSDTEVIMAAFDMWGTKSFNMFNGMFAFCLVNTNTNVTYLVRDRFGVKPLYWTLDKGKIFFASEIKALSPIVVSPVLNRSVLNQFVSETVSDINDDTCIESIKQVKPGNFVKINKSCNAINNVWYKNSDFHIDKNIFKSHDKTLEYFENLLIDSIKIRYRSDVPVCITLSGGLDSTLIYVLTKEHIDKSIRPFTYVHIKSDTSEYKIVKQLTNKYNDNLTVVSSNLEISPNILEKILYYLDFPSWNFSPIAYFDMYKSIRDHGYKVVIEGHGSDELLGGYPYLVEIAWKELLLKFNFVEARTVFDVYNSTVNEKLSPVDDNWMSRNFVIRSLKFYLDYFIGGVVFFGFQKSLNRAFNRNIIPIVLRTFDRMTMANSVESRSPFMDYRIVEFLNFMPMKYKINKIGSKAILREILKKYGLDFVYKNKSKMGFAVDIPKLLSNKSFSRYAKLVIDDNQFDEYSSLKYDALELLRRGKISWNKSDVIWKMLSINLIYKNYVK